MPFAFALALAGSALGQESEKTTIRTTETTVKTAGGANLLHELWNVWDAVPIPCGETQLRFTYRWETAGAPANRYDSNDDHILQPSIWWGAAECLELGLTVPVWVGDGGEIPGQQDGQADTYFTALYRVWDQVDYWPAGAFSSTVRIPTGVRSDGIDADLRLNLTNDYDSGLRSHFNIWGKTVNTTNGEVNPELQGVDGDEAYIFLDESDEPVDPRHFQYGASIGLDGCLNEDGSLRWVVDYVNRTSQYYGHSNLNLLDVGWQLEMGEGSHLGMSVMFGLDDNEETPNAGAAITYAMPLTY
jgi:hypothetical protein